MQMKFLVVRFTLTAATSGSPVKFSLKKTSLPYNDSSYELLFNDYIMVKYAGFRVHTRRNYSAQLNATSNKLRAFVPY